MEEVLIHVHPGSIIPDVLTRQYEHRSGRFGRNLFQCYSTALHSLVDLIDRTGLRGVKKASLEAWILRAFTNSETDDDLILHAHGFIFLLLSGHMFPDFSGNLVHVVVYGSIRDARQIGEP
ncbi:hypothetical protein M9H77_31013 [Catharanthus roseus]|uniref:Uncharacterized protein n=1 Tax=Catharanthus roseus TaxID=4058 RepID=A0ACB9ZZU3_CATRO|nr:hypothetical protein M9H77_31013 [Catharanthus roseus]